MGKYVNDLQISQDFLNEVAVTDEKCCADVPSPLQSSKLSNLNVDLQHNDGMIVVVKENELKNTENDALNGFPQKTGGTPEVLLKKKSIYDNLLCVNQILFNTENVYPANFPNIEVEFGGLIITPADFNSLKAYSNQNQYLTDNIINGFFSLLPLVSAEAGFEVAPFDTHFIVKIRESGEASYGFRRWAKYNDIWRKNLWLIPIDIQDTHWSLLVVLLHRKIMIHLDSLHWDPESEVINGICNFIQSESPKEINWLEWTLYKPTDNPSQITPMTDRVSGNCGVHVCTWAYLIASGTIHYFSENDMNIVRVGIVNFLCHMNMSQDLQSRLIKSRDKLYDAPVPKKFKYDLKKLYDTMIERVTPILGFKNIFEICASLGIIVACEKPVSVTRRRRSKK